MIKRLSLNSERNLIIKYIGEDYYQCLYLYLDVVAYDIEKKEIECWIQYDNSSIVAVALKYHNAIHVFSKDYKFNVKELVDFLVSLTPFIICASERLIDIIGPYFPEYIKEMGVVSRLSDIDYIEDKEVREADIDDFYSIAKMIYEDEDSGASYDYDDLVTQMKERYNKHFSRNFIIKDGDLVIANVSTGGECEKFCTLNNVIVRKEYRRRGLAARIYRNVCSELTREGKVVYSIYYVKESIALHEKIGFVECCKYGKLFKRIH